jgi:hypothetical protein
MQCPYPPSTSRLFAAPGKLPDDQTISLLHHIKFRDGRKEPFCKIKFKNPRTAVPGFWKRNVPDDL